MIDLPPTQKCSNTLQEHYLHQETAKRPVESMGRDMQDTSMNSVHSCQQKSIDLKFSKSQTGSDVRYSCHHNS